MISQAIMYYFLSSSRKKLLFLSCFPEKWHTLFQGPCVHSGESLYCWLVVLLTAHTELTFCLEGSGPKDHPKDLSKNEGSIYKTSKPLISRSRRTVMKGIASCFKILKILWFIGSFQVVFYTSKLDSGETGQAEYRITIGRKTLKRKTPVQQYGAVFTK